MTTMMSSCWEMRRIDHSNVLRAVSEWKKPWPGSPELQRTGRSGDAVEGGWAGHTALWMGSWLKWTAASCTDEGWIESALLLNRDGDGAKLLVFAGVVRLSKLRSGEHVETGGGGLKSCAGLCSVPAYNSAVSSQAEMSAVVERASVAKKRDG